MSYQSPGTSGGKGVDCQSVRATARVHGISREDTREGKVFLSFIFSSLHFSSLFFIFHSFRFFWIRAANVSLFGDGHSSWVMRGRNAGRWREGKEGCGHVDMWIHVNR